MNSSFQKQKKETLEDHQIQGSDVFLEQCRENMNFRDNRFTSQFTRHLLFRDEEKTFENPLVRLHCKNPEISRSVGDIFPKCLRRSSKVSDHPPCHKLPCHGEIRKILKKRLCRFWKDKNVEFTQGFSEETREADKRQTDEFQTCVLKIMRERNFNHIIVLLSLDEDSSGQDKLIETIDYYRNK